jgi:hypothetical protein
MRVFLSLTFIFFITFLLSAQDAGRGGPPAGGAARAPLAIPGFPDGSQIPVKLVRPLRVLPSARVRRRR